MRLTSAICALFLAASAHGAGSDWPFWDRFATAFVDRNGRVVDWNEDGRTVSEGQAYALFFSLVANDQRTFDRILGWTRSELTPRGMDQQLPAWLWGRRNDQSWGVLDANSATDADLWIAYSLIEAGRLWDEPDYTTLGRRLLDAVAACCVVRHAGRRLLLPGPEGFTESDGTVRINLSYYVPVQLRLFAAVQPDGPWGTLLTDYIELLGAVAPLGRVPDWVRLAPASDGQSIPFGVPGSYDAIRVYLWNAIGPSDGLGERARDALRGFASLNRALPHTPERWTNANGGLSGTAPVGYHGALYPFWRAVDADELAHRARSALEAAEVGGLYGAPARYYDQALIGFGLGYSSGHYRFDDDGRLLPAWRKGRTS